MQSTILCLCIFVCGVALLNRSKPTVVQLVQFLYMSCVPLLGHVWVCPFVRPVVKIKTVCVCTLVKSLTVHLAVS